MVLLKYFGKEMKEDWNREVDVVQGLSSNEDPQDNLLHYRWHSKGKRPSLLKMHPTFLHMFKKIHSFHKLSKKRKKKPKSTAKKGAALKNNRFLLETIAQFDSRME